MHQTANVYPSPAVVPSSLAVPTSPAKPEVLQVRAPGDGVGDYDDLSDPNRITSPIGTKLLHRKVHLQLGYDVDDEGGDMAADPNQCSSPSSTELMHRRVANQRAHPHSPIDGRCRELAAVGAPR